jgi:BASS family bile acid:Na+ symporter
MVRTLAAIAVPLAVLGLGLRSATLQPGYFWRRRSLWWRSLLATCVLVPAFAIGLTLALRLPPTVGLGLTLLALSPSAPLAPRQALRLGGDPVYAFHLHLTLALLSVVILPPALGLLGRALHIPLRAEMRPIVLTLLLGQVVPLGVGLAVRALSPKLAAPLGKIATAVGNVLLAVLLVIVVVTSGRDIASLGGASLGAIFVVAVAALLVGHAVGGPARETRRVLAIESASRHPGVALLVATVNLPGENVLPAIGAYLIVSLLVVLAYGFVDTHIALQSEFR